MLNKLYTTESEFMNFKSKFQICRRILFCTTSLSHKYFIKKDHTKYIDKMNFLFERMFFFLREWFKYLQYYIVECGNPELKIVKELKENLLPLSFNERHLLFYQKPEESSQDLSPGIKEQKELFHIQCNNIFHFSKCLRFFF